MSDIIDVDHHTMYNGKVKIDGTRLIDCETYTIKLSAAASEKIGAYHNKNVNGEIQYRDYQNGYTQIFVGVAGDNNGVKSFTPLNNSKQEFTENQVKDILNLTQEAVREKTNDPNFELDVHRVTYGTEYAPEQSQKSGLISSLKAKLEQIKPKKIDYDKLSAREQSFYDHGTW